MSTPERNLPHLPERAQALLDGWPAPERGALEWEDTAGRTMVRVRETTIGSTADDLLGPPLPPERGEGSFSAEPAEEEPMLASIARAVVAGTRESAPSGVARDVLLAAEGQRRSVPPASPSLDASAQGGRLALRGHPSQSRSPSVQAVHESTARSELPEPRSSAGERRRAPGLIALGAGAALALAAGAALYVSVRHTAPGGALAGPSAEAPVAALARATDVATQAPPPARAAEPEPSTQAIALDGLPAAPDTASAGSPPAKTTSAASGATKDSLAFRVKSAPMGAGKLVLEERDDEPTPGQLNSAPATRAGAAQREAVAPEPGLPAQPSLGAVQAAVGSVMSGARSCLAGQDSGSKATLKFGPSGRVSSVMISGPAAGTPAESCVRSALMGARVPPFSEPSFSAALTIRPP